MKKIAIIVLVILCMAVFVACNTTGEDGNKTVTVTFFLNNGDAAVTILTSDGLLHSDVCPNPSKEGFDFLGWFFDDDGTERVTFPLEVSENLSIYASWLKRSETAYTATFVTNGGTAVGDYTGKSVNVAPSTTREGYTLEGWYLDPNFTTYAHFPYTLTENATFYAKFELTGVAYDTDEAANTLIFRWPAQEGATYEVTATNYSSIEVFTSNGVATCSLSVKDAFPFTVEIDKNTGAGKNEIYRRAFANYPTFDLEKVEISSRDNNVEFVFADDVGAYQIVVADPSVDGEIIYTSSAKTFVFPAEYFSSEKTVYFRNVKDDPQKVNYSFRSPKTVISRYDTPVFGRYRDAESNLSWKSVGDDVSYTVAFYLGDEIIKIDENAKTDKTDAAGYCYYSFSPASLFPNGEYKEFGVKVSANRKFDRENRVFILSSGSGETNKIAFVGAAKITLREDKIIWNDLLDASSYDVELTCNGKLDDRKSRTYTSLEEKLVALTTGGVYNVTVKPNARDLNKYTVPATEEYSLLDLPEISVLVNGSSVQILIGREVYNAENYLVNIIDAKDGERIKSDTLAKENYQIVYPIKDFRSGEYMVDVIAIGDGVNYYNSPASYAYIRRFAKPEVEFTSAGTSLTVKITVEADAKYHIDYRGVAGFIDTVEEGEGVKELTFDQKNYTDADVAFDMSVYAYHETPFEKSNVTHNPLNASTFYIRSEEETKTVYLLCSPAEFRVQNEERLSWKVDMVKAYFEVKLDDKNADGLIMPLNSSGVDISELLAFYGKQTLPAGDHTLYLRRRLTGNSVLFSDYAMVQVKKLDVARDVTFINKTLNWSSYNESTYGYKLVWTATEDGDDKVEYNPGNYDLPLNCKIEMNDRTSGATDMYFRIVCLGNLGENVLDSEPSEAYLIRRLSKPTLTAEDGVLSWEAADDKYELYDGDVVLRTLTENSFDIKSLGAGRYYFTVKCKSADPDVFDSERSTIFDAVVLKTPSIEKICDATHGYVTGIKVDNADGASLYYELTASELDDIVTIETRTIGDYVFRPDANGSLKAGGYKVKLRAMGNGVHVVTSDYSNELEYYKLSVPEVEVDYRNELVRIKNGDVQDAYVVDEYLGALNGNDFVLADKTADNFLKPSIVAAEVGVNPFSLKAVSYGNLPSNVLSLTVRRLTAPVVDQNDTSLFSDVEIVGESYSYTVNSSEAAISTSNRWTFVSLPLKAGYLNELTFVRRADKCLDSPVTEYSLRKLATPSLTFDFDEEKVAWTAIPYAEDYVCSLRDVTRTVTGLNATFAYVAGENVIDVYARAAGAVDSDVYTIKVNKLFKPVVERVGANLSWSVPYGATGFIVSQNGKSVTTDEHTYALDTDNIGVGVNTYTVIATASDYISSDPATDTVTKLTAPSVSQTDTALICDEQAKGETYVYKLNSLTESVNNTGEWAFDDLSLTVGENTFVVYRRANGYLDSDSTTYKIVKLAAPILGLNAEYKASFGEVSGASVYEYTFGETSDTTSSRVLDLAFSVGENTVSVRAKSEGKVSSDLATKVFVKLSAPTISRDGLNFSWTCPEGATGYKLYLNGSLISTTDKLYATLDESLISEGVNTLQVSAVADGKIPSGLSSLAFDKLYAPRFISIGERVSWGSVVGASKYEYEFNGEVGETTDSFLDLDIPEDAGAYAFKIRAVGNRAYASDFVALEFTRLVAPTLTIDSGTVSWDAIEDAYGYVVYVDGEKAYEGSARSYTLTGGESEIRVAAYNEIIGVFGIMDLTE